MALEIHEAAAVRHTDSPPGRQRNCMRMCTFLGAEREGKKVDSVSNQYASEMTSSAHRRAILRDMSL